MSYKKNFFIFENYIPRNKISLIENYVKSRNEPKKINKDFKIVFVRLPNWAIIDKNIKNYTIPVIKDFVIGNNLEYKQVEWIDYALFLLTNNPELISKIKNKNKSNSYNNFLSNKQKIIYSKAWVNRILIFLRMWISREIGKDADEIFGPLPKPEILLTHDIDYIKTTLQMRLKYFVKIIITFTSNNKMLLNFLKLFKNTTFWEFNKIIELEKKYDKTSVWNFYSKTSKYNISPKSWLLNPSYNISNKKFKKLFNSLRKSKHKIGLHQSYESYNKYKVMKLEKLKIESVTEEKVKICRQHWLHFDIFKTWSIQEACGFELDLSLGFNDNWGFRNSSAFKCPAWLNDKEEFSKSLFSLPLILMDSHLFDNYKTYEKRTEIIDRVLDEIMVTRGNASIVWHQRVFNPEYGWDKEYKYLLEGMKEREIL